MNPQKEYVRELKQKSACATCPENDWRVLEFHHRDPKTKNDSISNMVRERVDMQKLLFEISLCIILCGNCHKKVHSHDNCGKDSETTHGESQGTGPVKQKV